MGSVTIAESVKIPTVDTITTLYTSPSSGNGTTITAFTAANSSGANASYKAYVYDSAGTAVDPAVPLKIVVRNRFDLGASIVNQIIPAGGTLRIENNIANSLSFKITGEAT
jgi:hypothetical protein